MNPFGDGPQMYAGMQVFLDRNLVDYVEDWSRVRSPGRARRRRKKHPQRIVMRAVARKEAYRFQGKLFMHPDMWRELQELTRRAQ